MEDAQARANCLHCPHDYGEGAAQATRDVANALLGMLPRNVDLELPASDSEPANLWREDDSDML